MEVECNGGMIIFFYVCQAGAKDFECGALLGPKMFDRRLDAMNETRSWYCPICGAHYKTSFGMLGAFHIDHKWCFVRMALNGDFFRMLRRLQATWLGWFEALQIWAEVPHLLPLNPGDLLEVVPPKMTDSEAEDRERFGKWKRGEYHRALLKVKDRELFRSLPLWDWVRINELDMRPQDHADFQGGTGLDGPDG